MFRLLLWTSKRRLGNLSSKKSQNLKENTSVIFYSSYYEKDCNFTKKNNSIIGILFRTFRFFSKQLFPRTPANGYICWNVIIKWNVNNIIFLLIVRDLVIFEFTLENTLAISFLLLLNLNVCANLFEHGNCSRSFQNCDYYSMYIIPKA